jgi:hypothetical protein
MCRDTSREPLKADTTSDERPAPRNNHIWGPAFGRTCRQRPGTYTVTFNLPFFNTLKRESIQLSAGFTATVNADMQIEAVREPASMCTCMHIDIGVRMTEGLCTKESEDAAPLGRY